MTTPSHTLLAMSSSPLFATSWHPLFAIPSHTLFAISWRPSFAMPSHTLFAISSSTLVTVSWRPTNHVAIHGHVYIQIRAWDLGVQIEELASVDEASHTCEWGMGVHNRGDSFPLVFPRLVILIPSQWTRQVTHVNESWGYTTERTLPPWSFHHDSFTYWVSGRGKSHMWMSHGCGQPRGLFPLGLSPSTHWHTESVDEASHTCEWDIGVDNRRDSFPLVFPPWLIHILSQLTRQVTHVNESWG